MGASALSLWKRKHIGSVDDCGIDCRILRTSRRAKLQATYITELRRILNHRRYIRLSRACINVRCKDCIACRIRGKCDPFSGKVMRESSRLQIEYHAL